MQKQAELRKKGILSWLRPDAKSQITFRYENGIIKGVDAVVLSTQHSPEIEQKELKEAIMELLIKKVIPSEWLDKDTKYHINPTGKFVIGGPVGDCRYLWWQGCSWWWCFFWQGP